MPTPKIIFRLEYNLPYKAGDTKSALTKRRDFVTCNSDHNLYNYLTRPSASDKTDIETIRIAEQLSENTEITERDLLEYASNRKGSTGAFWRAGDLSSSDAKELKSQLRNTESIVWTAVLSFEEEYGRKVCNNKAQAQELIKKTLPALFKDTRLKYENIEWYGALHENTDNRHVHLCFWEKEPTFSRKGSTELHFASQREKIREKDCDNFKFEVAKFCNVENLSSFKKRDALRKDFRQNMNTERKKIAVDLLLDAVKQSNSWQYGKQSKDTQDKILAFAMDIIRSDTALENEYISYVKEVTEQQQKYFDICRTNNIKVTPEIQNFAEKNIQDLHTRLGNDVLSSLKYYNDRIEKKTKNLALRESNFAKLSDNDLKLLDYIKSKPIGTTFERYFSTKDLISNKYENARCLGLSAILINFTQDKEQFNRILDASALFDASLDVAYSGQLDWATNIDKIDKNTSYRNVLFNLCYYQYVKNNEDIILEDYNPTQAITSLTEKDKQVIEKIKNSKLGDKFSTLANLLWKQTNKTSDGTYKNYFINFYSLTNVITKFSKDKEQVHRILASTNAYRPSVFNKQWQGQIEWINSEELKTETFGNTVIEYCIKENQANKETSLQGKTTNTKKILTKNDISTRALNNIFLSTLKLCTTKFDNTFNQFRNAIKDQERKRKQFEGVNIYE